MRIISLFIGLVAAVAVGLAFDGVLLVTAGFAMGVASVFPAVRTVRHQLGDSDVGLSVVVTRRLDGNFERHFLHRVRVIGPHAAVAHLRGIADQIADDWAEER